MSARAESPCLRSCIGAPLTNSHNVRSARLLFNIPTAGVLHGFAGYFEAVLYGDIGISTHPERMDVVSPEMTSWFPIFFPVKAGGLPNAVVVDSHLLIGSSVSSQRLGASRFHLAPDGQAKSLV